MSIKAVLFDLDDTLLWDDRSVSEAFRSTCRYGAEATGVDEQELEAAVRREARALYETYETFGFTQMIGINPFEALWGKFERGEHPMFRKLQELAPGYRQTAWTKGLAAVGVDNPGLGSQLAEMFPTQRRKLKYVYDETFEVLEELKKSYKLLLLTNDGDLAHKLTHPSHRVPKTYHATVERVPHGNALEKLAKGIKLDDGMTAPAEVEYQDIDPEGKYATIAITIYEGRNRQVRRMFEAIRHPVTRLKRISFGGLYLDNLQRGKHRKLTAEELGKLREIADSVQLEEK